MLKFIKYIFALIVLTTALATSTLNTSTLNKSTLNKSTINIEAISKVIVIKDILENEIKDQKNKSQESFTSQIEQELDITNPDDLANITKAGGNVTTAQDFSAINAIIKTSNTGVSVIDSGVTIDSNNNIYGINTLNATGISLPASTANTPGIIFPGTTTNTGIYSSAQDTVNISSQNFNLASFGPSGVSISPGKNFTVSSPATFNGQTTFKNAATFAGTTTINSGATISGPINIIGSTNLNGSTTNINGTVNLTNQNTLNGSTNINGPTNITNSLNIATGCQIALANGYVASPTLTFNADTTSGIYSPNTNQVSISAQGAQRMLFATGAVTIAANNTLTLPSTSSGTPALNFTNNLTTGISATGNTLSLNTAGAERLSISSAGIAKFSATGSATGPVIQIGGNTNTGIYSASANTLSLCASGADKIILNSTGVSISTGNTLTVPAGTQAAPSITSSYASNCGINFSSTGVIDFCQTGSNKISVYDSGSTFFTKTNPSTQALSGGSPTLSISNTNYDIFPFTGSFAGANLATTPGLYPYGTIKVILNTNASGVVYFNSRSQGFSLCGDDPYNANYCLILPGGHGAMLVCYDPANGYWFPIAGY